MIPFLPSINHPAYGRIKFWNRNQLYSWIFSEFFFKKLIKKTFRFRNHSLHQKNVQNWSMKYHIGQNYWKSYIELKQRNLLGLAAGLKNLVDRPFQKFEKSRPTSRPDSTKTGRLWPTTGRQLLVDQSRPTRSTTTGWLQASLKCRWIGGQK